MGFFLITDGVFFGIFYLGSRGCVMRCSYLIWKKSKGCLKLSRKNFEDYSLFEKNMESRKKSVGVFCEIDNRFFFGPRVNPAEMTNLG